VFLARVTLPAGLRETDTDTERNDENDGADEDALNRHEHVSQGTGLLLMLAPGVAWRSGGSYRQQPDDDQDEQDTDRHNGIRDDGLLRVRARIRQECRESPPFGQESCRGIHAPHGPVVGRTGKCA